MISFDYLEGLRGIEVVVLSTVFVVFTIRYVRSFKEISSGQRLLFGSFLLYILTASWDTWNYFVRHSPFSWRVLPLIAALTLSFAYMLEPSSQTRRRYGQDPLAPEKGCSPQEAEALRLENQELRDRLYELISAENKLSLRVIELESENEQYRRRSVGHEGA